MPRASLRIEVGDRGSAHSGVPGHTAPEAPTSATPHANRVSDVLEGGRRLHLIDGEIGEDTLCVRLVDVDAGIASAWGVMSGVVERANKLVVDVQQVLAATHDGQ
jgi:hypothetical protein